MRVVQQKIRKAVFPVAGLGTRFLPATKAMPKEMLPIVDRPLIQLAVDEAREAGIEHLIFVTGRNKAVVEDHFDRQYELESHLSKKGRSRELLQLQEDLPQAGQVSYTRQQEPLGLGHAIMCARRLVADEAFAILLPDMVMRSKPGCLAQMIETYNASPNSNVVAVQETASAIERYGVVGFKGATGDVLDIDGMVEKPPAGTAPSNFIVAGRYIFQPEIFSKLEQVTPGAGGELQLTDAMLMLLQDQAFLGHVYHGDTYDCGDKAGFLCANIAFALSRPDLSAELKSKLEKIVQEFKGNLTWQE